MVYRIPHFHLIHRAMHPWKTTAVPDIGKFLYKQVTATAQYINNPKSYRSLHLINVYCLRILKLY